MVLGGPHEQDGGHPGEAPKDRAARTTGPHDLLPAPTCLIHRSDLQALGNAQQRFALQDFSVNQSTLKQPFTQLARDSGQDNKAAQALNLVTIPDQPTFTRPS